MVTFFTNRKVCILYSTSKNENSKVDAYANKHLVHIAHDKDDNEKIRETEIDSNISTQQVYHC